jgi:hypothetical protein
MVEKRGLKEKRVDQPNENKKYILRSIKVAMPPFF